VSVDTQDVNIFERGRSVSSALRTTQMVFALVGFRWNL